MKKLAKAKPDYKKGDSPLHPRTGQRRVAELPYPDAIPSVEIGSASPSRV
jgi:hypothetical protein